jgi:probable rRNA maturation factor
MEADEYDKRIAVRISDEGRRFAVDSTRLERLARTVCVRFGVETAAVHIAIVGNGEIEQLNRRFLNREGITDVISFDLSDAGESPARVFDIAVNGEIAAARAADRGIEPAAELALYIAHGLLHNLGFDDAAPREAARMHKAEDEILQELGYGVVYYS